MRWRGGIHSDFVGFEMRAESLSIKERGVEEGRGRGDGVSVLGGGGSQSARREPPAIRRLLTIFSLMDIHIGENLIELYWPQSI